MSRGGLGRTRARRWPKRDERGPGSDRSWPAHVSGWWRRRGDRGATTVLVAVLFVVLFAFAAVGVELADLYSRRLTADQVTDRAALAGAQELPDPCRAVAGALASLQDSLAQVRSDTAVNVSDTATLAATLSDRELANGEIQVLRELDPASPPGDDPAGGNGDWLDTSGCPGTATGQPGSGTTGPGRVLRVVSPPATVRFPLASAASALARGSSSLSGNVQGTAAVEVRALGASQVAPFFLTADCVAGGGGSRVLVTTAFSPLTGATSTPSPSPTATGEPTDPSGLPSPPLSPPSLEPSDPPASTPGGTPAATGETGLDCLGAERGDFGYFDSDRLTGASSQGNESNMSVGLDHPLASFPGAPAEACLADGSPPGARMDTVLDRAGNNCVRVYLDPAGQPTLWSAREVTDGMIDGWPPVVGRLDVTRTSFTPPVSSSCTPAGDLADFRYTVETVPATEVWLTTLSCYLGTNPATGSRHTLVDAAAGVPGAVDLAVYDDPRFFLVPVLSSTPTGSGNATRWWPVEEFWAGFVTDEHLTFDALGSPVDEPATCRGTVPAAVGPDRQECAGIRVELGGGLVETLTVFVFPTSVFPTDISGVDNGVPYVAGPRDLVPVE